MNTNANNIDTTMRTITLGEIQYYNETMPVIEVLVNDKVMGYLSPFRKYAFQVSKTFEGEWDLGSTRVFGLNNLMNCTIDESKCGPSNLNWVDGEAQEYLLQCAALMALQKFSKGKMAINLGKTIWDDPEDGKCYENNLARYISRVVKYLRNQ